MKNNNNFFIDDIIPVVAVIDRKQKSRLILLHRPENGSTIVCLQNNQNKTEKLKLGTRYLARIDKIMERSLIVTVLEERP